jgi:hypothetical protein
VARNAAGRPIAAVATVLIACGYSWWATAFQPFTGPALAATLAGGLLAVAIGTRLRRTAPPWPGAPSGVAVWGGLLLALGAWELASFLHHPRLEHPTLSSMANELFRSHPARAVGETVWLALGAWLAQRR